MDLQRERTRSLSPRRLTRPAAALAAVGLAAAGLAGAPAAQVFRSGIDLASFGVTVVDRKGGLVTDLTRDDFEVREDGQPQTLTLFARGDALESVPPLHLGLLFDTSGSMEESIGFSRSAAIKFLNTVQEARDITLVDFDTEVRVVRYGQHDFARLVERIRKRKPDGNTALYDALGVYLDGSSSEEGRRTLVLYTDGGDTSSSMSYGEAQTLLRASDITLYAIGFLSHLSQSLQMDQRLKIRTARGNHRGARVLPDRHQGPRRDLRQDRGGDPRPVHARLPVDEHEDRRRLAEGGDQGEAGPA